jgi:hypothetical protein
MQTVSAIGAWPVQAEGVVVWLDRAPRKVNGMVGDRASEVLYFRAALSQALLDLEGWSPAQHTLGGQLLLQGYREALLTDAWSQRVSALIDKEGLTSPVAVAEAASQICQVMGRNPDLHDRVVQLQAVSAWLATRLAPPVLPPDAIIATMDLSPVECLDVQRPTLIAGPEPSIVGQGPLVWGVPGLGPSWDGRRIAINQTTITLDPPAAYWWHLKQDRLNGHPVCPLKGNVDMIDRMSKACGRPPVALVQRLDDLAAVPLFANTVAGVAIDLDQLGKWSHPGVEFLLMTALTAGLGAGIPVLVGGAPAHKQPDHWLSLGFTALFTKGMDRGGDQSHAIRRRKETSL